MSLFKTNNAIFLFAGECGGSYLNDFQRFNAKEKTWETLLPVGNKDIEKR